LCDLERPLLVCVKMHASFGVHHEDADRQFPDNKFITLSNPAYVKRNDITYAEKKLSILAYTLRHNLIIAASRGLLATAVTARLSTYFNLIY